MSFRDRALVAHQEHVAAAREEEARRRAREQEESLRRWVGNRQRFTAVVQKILGRPPTRLLPQITDHHGQIAKERAFAEIDDVVVLVTLSGGDDGFITVPGHDNYGRPYVPDERGPRVENLAGLGALLSDTHWRFGVLTDRHTHNGKIYELAEKAEQLLATR